MKIIELLNFDGINPQRKSATNGGEYSSSCPICGGKDRFLCWPEEKNGGRWWCRQCGKGGDCIQYLRDIRGLSYVEACQYLGQEPEQHTLSEPRENKSTWKPRQYKTPGELWSQKAGAFVKWAEQLLKSKNNYAELCGNQSSHNYLEEKRGLSFETIKKYSLGWNDSDKYRRRKDWGLDDNGKKLWIPKGVVIPYFRNGVLQRVRIRTGLEPPYYFLPGSNANSMILNTDRSISIIIESELDAMLINQECKELVSVIALGNAQTRPDEYTEKLLRESDLILIALDGDRAGAKETWQWWIKNFDQAKRCPPIGGKDPGEMWQAGIDLREWVKIAIDEYLPHEKRYTIPTKFIDKDGKVVMEDKWGRIEPAILYERTQK